ncbi:hypothetical protein [Alkalihalobacillus trypoxylicola]|uniref:Uncharacterized protein n=1 Tax=Alkalihalobacillus trypoxylicola TaxID=519424 RepID=A0A162ES20_9BACI|nr:hypothetical protein [Alkalihalobacillus trypoxylicola]KYG33576.1 hypothetical protein AZF04_16590 [Alkalihalobacillus trypoxylicola]
MQQQNNMQQSFEVQSQTQAQPLAYQEPPQVLSVKDSLYISDMLSWNLDAMKKAHFYAEQCQDIEIKQALETAGRMHQKHYDSILSHFQNQQQNQNSTIQQH